MTSTVYFVSVGSVRSSKSLEKKLAGLFDASAAGETISEGDLVTIKIHFGEPGTRA